MFRGNILIVATQRLWQRVPEKNLVDKKQNCICLFLNEPVSRPTNPPSTAGADLQIYSSYSKTGSPKWSAWDEKMEQAGSQSASQPSIHPSSSVLHAAADWNQPPEMGENSEFMADGAFVKLVLVISKSQKNKKNKTNPVLPDGEHWRAHVSAVSTDVHIFNRRWWQESGERDLIHIWG